jgi:hypothetical protein
MFKEQITNSYQFSVNFHYPLMHISDSSNSTDAMHR